MSLSTKTRLPGVAVTLFKNVGRKKVSGSGPDVSTRFAGQQSVLDVTRFLGERGAVRVHKSVRSPAGEFSIEFTDQLVPSADDSIYGLFEPMDVVEIRMAANAYQYNSTKKASITIDFPGADNSASAPTSSLPIMMRGFISKVTRTEGMGSDGRPARKVIISGQDYGKIWQIYNIYFNPFMPDGENYITQFKLFTRFGLGFQTTSAGQFVKDVFSRILNPFIDTMQANANGATNGSSPLLNIGVEVQSNQGTVSPFGVGDWQGGSIYALLQQYCDVGLWNELFIEDRKTGPYVVYRPNPFLAAGGDPSNSASYLNGNTTLPDVTSITRNDVISIDVSRTDGNVANYFWVEAPQYDMNFDFVGKAMASQGGDKSTFIFTNYGNNDPALYGLKRMAEQTNQGSPFQTAAGGTPKAQNQKDSGSSLDWINQRRASLVAQNRDNIVFETGSMRIVGNENVKAGTYLVVKHGNMHSNYYVVAAAHALSPFGAYITTVSFERGTGFIDRSQKGGSADSPYWAELADAQL